MPRPRVSFVIPSYNQKREWLTEAVESVLRQTVPVECIVVDDGSEQPFAFLAPVRVIRHETNRGVAAALNTGIRAMTSDWFCWLSSDDLVSNEKCERQLVALEESGCKASCHPYKVVSPAGALIGYSALPPLMAEMLGRNYEAGRPQPTWWKWNGLKAQQQDFAGNCWVNGSTCMIHRSVIEDVGMLDESYRFGQDWEWWCRIGANYQWVIVNQILGVRREGENLTERINRNDGLRAVRDAEDRRVREYARSVICE